MSQTNKRLLFLCPDTKTATGGIKQIYRQVDILRANGFDAYILHSKKGFRPDWFKNSTPIITYKDFYFEKKINSIREKIIRKNKLKHKLKIIYYTFLKKTISNNKIDESDIIIFPEVYGLLINFILPKNKKVIFNQNCYYTFDLYPINDKAVSSPYTNSNTLATIVASKDAFDYMNFVFPAINLFKIRLGINSDVFSYSQDKSKQIAFMPRKLPEDVVQVINILKEHNQIPEWEFVEIDNMNETEVATVLQKSAIFLSFNTREGFGLPPAEAMACGCVVIGYQGRGGEEYFDKSFSYPINDRDIISFVKEIESVCKMFNENHVSFIDKGKKASDFILNEYNSKNEENDLLEIWNQIMTD